MKRFPLLPRKKNSDKSHFGHVLIVAGSKSMSGAALLAARAALKSGSGLVTVATVKPVADLIARTLPEAMLLPLPSTKEGSISHTAYEKILSAVRKKKINVLAVGPGLSQNSQTANLVHRIVSEISLPVVLDADGLNAFKCHVGATDRSPLRLNHKSALLLTPHAREFERLFGVKPLEKDPARLQLAKKFSKLYDVALVLKGHRSIVVDGDRAVVNKTGNPGMAKGGSGDVLTGVIAAFIAQGLDRFQAARWAVYFHGKAGDLAAKEKSELSLLASDIISYLPRAFKKAGGRD